MGRCACKVRVALCLHSAWRDLPPPPPVLRTKGHSWTVVCSQVQVEQLVSLGTGVNVPTGSPLLSCWFSTYSTAAAPGTVLTFSPTLRLLNRSSWAHLSYRVDSGKQHAIATVIKAFARALEVFLPINPLRLVAVESYVD